jgi:Domain of unknown function (DUF4410)
MATFIAFQASAIDWRTRLLISAAAMLIVAGCATKPDVKIEQGIALGKYTCVEVASAQNETGNSANDTAASTFRDDLLSALRSEGVGVSEACPAGAALLVKPALVHYEAGSALARWVVPGAGRTQATVAVGLVDKASGQSVGDLGSTEQVATGGLLSAGADRWILTVLANGMAAEIGSRIKGQ